MLLTLRKDSLVRASSSDVEHSRGAKAPSTTGPVNVIKGFSGIDIVKKSDNEEPSQQTNSYV